MPDQHTIDTSKNYVGKILRTTYVYNGQEHSRVGIVYQQEKEGDHLRFTMLLPNGQEWKQPFTTESITKMTSVHMDESLRKALKDLCNVKLEQQAFLKQFWAEKLNYERKVAQAQAQVQELSGELSEYEFRTAIENLFREKYPTTGGYDTGRYFEINSWCKQEVTMRHVQEIQKWANPEQYPFMYREYDDNYFINENHPGYKSFCERHAAPLIPALKDYCKGTGANVGDKRHLTVSRYYTFQIIHGFSRQSLQEISTILDGTRTKTKKSLNAQITNANKIVVESQKSQVPLKELER